MEIIKIGKKAPNFRLKDQAGLYRSLKDFKSKYLVIFFYPKDSTPGCTIEARGFSKLLHKFSKLDVQVIGISGGDVASKEKFCQRAKLDTDLLADTDFLVAKKYGVYGKKKFMGREYLGINRATYVIGPDRKVMEVFEKVNPLKHPTEVLLFLKNQEDK